MDQVNISYKEYHENYLSNQKGCSLFDVPLLLLIITHIGFQLIYLRCFFAYRNHLNCFLVDLVLAVLPFTFLVICPLVYLPAGFFLVFLSYTLILTKEFYYRQSSVALSKAFSSRITAKRRPFVTNFKGMISLLSVICILAVDFTVFPKSHIKTETYGYSLMDTGVGFFIVANGLTFNVKKTKGLSSKSFISNVPVLILGLIRYVTTEKINYQKHVTEYGVHWNFFFTLAVVKTIGPYMANLVRPKWYFMASCLGLHELVLAAGLETWVMSDTPRIDLVSANREGIVSILGYLELYTVGAHLGSWLLFTNSKPIVKEEMKKGLKMIAFAFLLMVYLHINVFFRPSRRLANPTFVIWMTSICLLFLGLSLIWETLVAVSCRRMNCGAHQDTTLFTLEAISANNLAFFLIGNLLTGAVNSLMKTLLLPTSLSVFIIICYTIAGTGLISVMHAKKVTLKFW